MPPDLLQIGDVEVDPATHCISHQGVSTKLEPRAMALLLYLAQRPGSVISREELEREIWSGMVVGYDALNNTVAKLRKAFKDDSRNPRFIRTVPKAGYQLIAEVRESLQQTNLRPGIQDSPSEPSLERKLAAILCTDVVDYSRLTGMDEEGTHRELRVCLDLIKSLVESFSGNVVSFAGDAILAEFATVSNALSCAIVVQQQLVERNLADPHNPGMEFRIGLNLGEVIVDRNDIYGDGVIVASRLEGLAEPGGICLSGSVFDAVGNKLPIDFTFLGERQVKNIEKPVRAYHARLKAGATIALPQKKHTRSRPRYSANRWIMMVVALILLAVTALWTGWQYWRQDNNTIETSMDATPFSGKPSIAVLPFKNISDDPAQEYFADGMTDDLIADLSKVSELAIIARQSVFTYKDKPIGINQIAKELRVQYVLEGSVKQVGGMIRVNANLIDTTNAQSLWSERYDSNASELFTLQNRVIDSIVTALAIELTDQEKSILSRLPTENMEAYDYYLRAERRRLVPPDNLRSVHLGNTNAIELYQRAIQLDPSFTAAYVGMALIGLEVWEFGSTQTLPSEVARKLAYDSASKVHQLDPENSAAWSILALLQATDGQHEIAIKSSQQAIELDPNSADAYAIRSKVLIYAGRHKEGLASIEKALELNPKPPAYFYGITGLAEFFGENYEQALFWLEKISNAEHFQHDLLMTYGELGMHEEARVELGKIRLFTPFANLGHYRIRYAHYKRQQDLEHMITALRKAGVPENAFGFEAEIADRLSSDELTALIAGFAWAGVDHQGTEFVQQVSDDGSIAFRNSYSMLTGEAWIEEDLFCVKFPGNLLGREDCGPVYRNPSGNAEERNQYVRVALGNIYYFSLK